MEPVTSLSAPPSARPSTDVRVARQPIYDPALKVVAYELLVEREDDGAAAIAEIGLSLVADHAAYVPISRSFLLEGLAASLPTEDIVLAVGPGINLDRAARDAIMELVASGYRLALMDFEPHGPLEPLLSYASVAGIDVASTDRGLLRAGQEHLAARGLTTLARNVEQHDELETCVELGFDLLQGHFICRPREVTEQGLKVNTMNRMRLIARLRDDQIDFDELQDIIGRDIALSYNLLRFINSAFFSLPRRVESIRDALALLGSLNVRKWATLMTLAESHDKPRELVVTGLVRARMCELLANAYGQKDLEGAFTTGLFSVVDALTDCSMVELLQSLPLSREIIEALLNHEGSKGRILRAAIAYERGDFAELDNLPPTRTPLSDLYADAVAWATEASGGLPA